MAENFLRARFTDYEAFEETLHKLKEAGVADYEAFGPTNLQEIEDLMPRRPSRSAWEWMKNMIGIGYRSYRESPVRFWATVGAILGLTSFFYMCVQSSRLFNLIVGGKPPVSNVPYVVPAYEGTILVGAIFAFAAVVIFARMGRYRAPSEYDPHFSDDSFGIVVRCEPADCEGLITMLRDSGAAEIDEAKY